MTGHRKQFLPDEWDMFTEDVATLRSLGRDLIGAVRRELADHRARAADDAAAAAEQDPEVQS
jgi:hypothetical protein